MNLKDRLEPDMVQEPMKGQNVASENTMTRYPKPSPEDLIRQQSETIATLTERLKVLTAQIREKEETIDNLKAKDTDNMGYHNDKCLMSNTYSAAAEALPLAMTPRRLRAYYRKSKKLVGCRDAIAFITIIFAFILLCFILPQIIF